MASNIEVGSCVVKGFSVGDLNTFSFVVRFLAIWKRMEWKFESFADILLNRQSVKEERLRRYENLDL